MDSALVFDLGGVLLVNEMFDELPKMIPEPIELETLKDRWLRSPSVRAFELGRCSPEVFAEAMVAEFALSVPADQFLEAFARWPTGLYAGAEPLLKSLRDQYQVACLSNSNELHWTKQIYAPFDRAYSSHLLGLIKPDRGVFEFVSGDLGCRAENILFFDDSQLNVDAAARCGWNAHLTVGFEQLTEVLRQVGVLPGP